MKVEVGAGEPEAPGASSHTDFTPAMAAAPPATQHAFDTSTTARDVAMAELRRLLAVWRAHEPGARLGRDAEELHQLRVTARRIDAVLGLFKRQLPAAVVRARRTTKALLRSLGAARDLDVQLSELARYCARLPESKRAAAAPLRAYLESARHRAHARMVRGLDSEPTRRWLETLAQGGAAGGDANGAERAMVVMPQRVRRRFRKLRKSVGKLRTRSPMEDYHQVRRRAKQLRYATECGAVLFGKPAEDMLKALHRLQDRLGVHQDAYMAQDRLAALAADPTVALPPATLFLMGRLAEHHAQLTAQARRTLERSWRKVRGKRWKALRARLGEVTQRADAANGACTVPEEAPEHTALAEPTSHGHVPAPEPRPVKH
jgi:CHAD domain-containing protein